MGSGDLVKDVAKFCQEIFATVDVFKFDSFNDIDHPSCLARGLLLGLSQVSLLANNYNLSACWFYWYNLNLLIELSSTIYSLTVPDGKV